jgi:hypothetical protein
VATATYKPKVPQSRSSDSHTAVQFQEDKRPLPGLITTLTLNPYFLYETVAEFPENLPRKEKLPHE